MVPFVGCSIRKQCRRRCCHPRDVVQPFCQVQVFVETTGWAFAYPLVWLAGCRVASYTHYPTVSTNMLQRVMARTATFNNDAQVRSVLDPLLWAWALQAVTGRQLQSQHALAGLSMVTARSQAAHVTA